MDSGLKAAGMTPLTESYSSINSCECQQYYKALGAVEKLKALATPFEQKFICGLGDARRLYVFVP